MCLVQLCQKDKAGIRQRRLVPVHVKKVALCSKICYLMSGANECQITKNGGKLVCPVNTDAVKKYFGKMKSLISRKPEKAA
jgi:hypothetical protein